jgi:diguanylate cyclase (GGDEF)-like protein/PAS domain S-box-containing protein
MLVVLLGWWFRPWKWFFILAASSTGLLIAGYLFSPAREAMGMKMELSHRFVAFLVIWGTAFLLSIVKRSEETLREREELQRSILSNAVDGIITIDAAGIVQSINAAGERLFGYSAAEIVGKNVSVLMPAPFADEHNSYLANYIRTGERKIIGIGRETIGLRKNGEPFPMDLAVSVVRSAGQRMFTGFVRDLTERKQAKEIRDRADMLEEMVRRDELTGLFNRRILMDTLEREVARSKRYAVPLSVHMIDIDHFKQVNDAHGHIVGDGVLARSAKAIQAAVRTSDVTARYGGEEFCIVLPQTDFHGALAFAERIHRQIAGEVYSGSGNQEFRVTCSIGVAEFDPESDDARSLLERADRALYQAKNSGRNQISSTER